MKETPFNVKKYLKEKDLRETFGLKQEARKASAKFTYLAGDSIIYEEGFVEGAKWGMANSNNQISYMDLFCDLISITQILKLSKYKTLDNTTIDKAIEQAEDTLEKYKLYRQKNTHK